ncbi:hypothetical protein ACEN88_00410 [Massilia sp. CT11-108]|uniref:hypothetical protein n=1 Tax=Massilia sp. CT11-108 TaxID=3393900 RepID=UPI0039A4C3C2
MPNRQNKNASTRGGAHVDQAGGLKSTKQTAVFNCSPQNITAVCEELARNGVALLGTSGTTQRETLRRALEFRGARGLNTYEGTAAGYMRLATRVKELKDAWDIYTLSEDVLGPDGLLHRGVARYVLMGRRKDTPPPQGELELVPA